MSKLNPESARIKNLTSPRRCPLQPFFFCIRSTHQQNVHKSAPPFRMSETQSCICGFFHEKHPDDYINRYFYLKLHEHAIRVCEASAKAKKHIKHLGSAIKEKSRKYTKKRNAPYEINISDLSPSERLCGDFPLTHTLRVDRAEWAFVEQHNFGGPLGRAPTGEEGVQPEEFGIWDEGDNKFRAQFVQPEDLFRNTLVEPDMPPGYEWAAVSTLPLPVKIERSEKQEATIEREYQVWASVYAGRREKEELLAIQTYITTRINEIDERTEAVLRPRITKYTALRCRYHQAQAVRLMEAAGIREPTTPDRRCGAVEHYPFSPLGFRPCSDLMKTCIVRDRLSSASIFRRGSAIRGPG